MAHAEKVPAARIVAEWCFEVGLRRPAVGAAHARFSLAGLALMKISSAPRSDRFLKNMILQRNIRLGVMQTLRPGGTRQRLGGSRGPPAP